MRRRLEIVQHSLDVAGGDFSGHAGHRNPSVAHRQPQSRSTPSDTMNRPVDAEDSQGERIEFLNDNTGILYANWQHALRVLELGARQGSLEAQRVLPNARNAEASPLDHVFEDVEHGREYGHTPQYTTHMLINRRNIIRHACNEYVNIATVMLHEFGHAQYNISAGAILRYDSIYSGEQAMYFENAYRPAVNMPKVLSHHEMPRRKQ